MASDWYEVVPPDVGLSQGDMIPGLPLVEWKPGPLERDALDVGRFEGTTIVEKAEAVVMTQACDLENEKVESVVVCPVITLDAFRAVWVADRESRGQGTSQKAWRGYCEDIAAGFIWNFAMLNGEEVEGTLVEHRVVDFHEIFTLPRVFLESFLQLRGESRVRLRPPYREHLSQAFARYFMRVGLPVDVEKIWESG